MSAMRDIIDKLDAIVKLTENADVKKLVAQVHAKYSDDPVDACWHATQDLAKLLVANGIHGYILKGDVDTDWGPVQHHWIVIDDEIILDPTVEQLGGSKTMFKDTSRFYKKYNADYADWAEF